MPTHIQGVSAFRQALRICRVCWVQALWEALTPHFVHEIPGHNGGVILVQEASQSVLQHAYHTWLRHVTYDQGMLMF